MSDGEVSAARSAIDVETDGPAYEYKPALMSAAHQFRLTDDALAWQVGRRSGRLPYDQIRRVRLSFRPVTMQSYRFQAELWPASGAKVRIASTSWRSMVEQERLDGAYVAFLKELHRRIAQVGARASFETGSPPLIHWAGLTVFVIVALGLAALTVRGLQSGALAGAAFVAVFLAAFLWQAGNFFRRNRPGVYAPDRIPDTVLPRP